MTFESSYIVRRCDVWFLLESRIINLSGFSRGRGGETWRRSFESVIFLPRTSHDTGKQSLKLFERGHKERKEKNYKWPSINLHRPKFETPIDSLELLFPFFKSLQVSLLSKKPSRASLKVNLMNLMLLFVQRFLLKFRRNKSNSGRLHLFSTFVKRIFLNSNGGLNCFAFRTKFKCINKRADGGRRETRWVNEIW